LALALSGLPDIPDVRVIVGRGTADDAGVFRVSEDLALVQTVDVLAPVVDDPYTYGRIAAVNSLSDVYAMGGDPLSALSVLGYPGGGDIEVMTDILKGAQDAVVEAGAALLGGHTFASDEIRFGLSVTGQINPRRIFTNAGARAGDRLILTKPLGVGIIISALVQRGALPAGILEPAVSSMLRLNRGASDIMRRFEVHACTDITGFGLLGHAWEMAEASGVALDIWTNKIPLLPGVMALLKEGVRDGAAKRNQASFAEFVQPPLDIDETIIGLLYCSETSGGLLMAVAPKDDTSLLKALGESGVEAQVVGEIRQSPPGRIFIRTT